VKRRIADTGETIELMGYTMVDGVQVEVTLTVNTVKLIHKLGNKAAYSKGRKAQMAQGLVKVTVDKASNATVRAQVQAKAEGPA
jgi:hypothetical protein